MTWDLDRQNDTVIVTFHNPVAVGWGELFEAVKVEVEAGARVVVFPKDLPAMTLTGMTVFQSLVRYLIGSGVEVRRGT